MRRRKIFATQFSDGTTSHSTDTNTVTQCATHNDCSSSNKLSSPGQRDNHESSTTNDDSVDELSRVLAEQHVNYDDLSEMRPREPSIILPPPSDFTATISERQCYSKSIDDNSKIIITPTTTSSSSKLHDEHQKMEQRRKHIDINTWIV